MTGSPHDEPSAEKSKLVVDEDWKSRVQAEKEAAARNVDNNSAAPQQGSRKPSSPPVDDAASGDETEAPAPPASFPLLVTSLAAQALAAMGMTVDPASGEPVARLDWAKHFVDMLGVLEEKSKNNLSPREEALLSNTLHELRMAFVAIKSQQQNSKFQREPDKPAAPGSHELEK